MHIMCLIFPRFKEIVNLLTFYSKQPFNKGEKAEGPRLAWWFHLFMPILAYPLVIIFSQIFSNKGFPALIGLIVLVLNLYRHSHRMEHISRFVLYSFDMLILPVVTLSPHI